MPDLSTGAIQAWGGECIPGPEDRVDRLIGPAEQHPAVASGLIALGVALDRVAQSAAPASILLATPTVVVLLRQVLEQLGPLRLVRILSWLVELPNGRALVTDLVRADDDPLAMLTTLHALNKQALLGRTFAAERLELLRRICTQAFGEPA